MIVTSGTLYYFLKYIYPTLYYLYKKKSHIVLYIIYVYIICLILEKKRSARQTMKDVNLMIACIALRFKNEILASQPLIIINE